MVYKWRTGSQIKGNAQVSGELFEQLSQTKEGLTAETLLNANKLKNAPLHNDYEWNNQKAANEWRLHQSRHFLNSLIVVMVNDETSEELHTRAVHITTEAHKYEPITTIIKEENKYAVLLENALAELNSFKRKYEVLKELKPVFEAIDKLKE